MLVYQKDRDYSLIIGDYRKPEESVEVVELQCRFDISKSSSNKDKTNSATIEVYNLSDKYLALLQTDYIAASFSAGYRDIGIKRLFAGEVTSVTTRQSGSDRVTQIQMGAGYTGLNHQALSKLVSPGRTVMDVVEEIRVSIPGISRGVYAGTNLNNPIISGYPLIGEPRRMLDQISSTYQVEWRVDDDVLYVNDMSGTITESFDEAYVVSPDSGLIEVPYYIAGDKRRAAKDPVKKGGVQFKCLLNPEIIPGEIIKLEYNDKFDGYYKVDSTRMYGDFRGSDWYVEAFCSEKVKV
jgi:hypothetical protein